MSWVMLQKNSAIYKYVMYDNTLLFNRGIMDVQIEGWNPNVPMNYDDIICIRTASIKLKSIPDLPLSLKEIVIRYSELTSVPVFPTGIQKVQLIHSKIEITDEQMAELRALYPKTFIQIENPNEFLSGKPVDIQAEEQIRHLQIARQEIRDAINDTRSFGKNKNVLNSDQTVHISSLNNCVCKAISIIKDESAKCSRVLNPINALFVDEKKGMFGQIIQCFTLLFNKQGQLHRNIKIWCNEKQVHSLHKLTFLELFQMIMNIVEVHPQRAELKERICIELTDSIFLCFTGRINRLVNALVGFIDGILIGLTVREMTQIKIQGLVQKLMDKKINVKQAKEVMTLLFAEVGDDDGLTDGFKRANLLALNDFEEETDELKETTHLLLDFDTDF